MPEIKHKFTFVEGNFETETGKLIAVEKNKYNEVVLCFQANMHIPFAQIKLYDRDLYVDAKATFEDAAILANEIAKRWNEYKAAYQPNEVLLTFKNTEDNKMNVSWNLNPDTNIEDLFYAFDTAKRALTEMVNKQAKKEGIKSENKFLAWLKGKTIRTLNNQ